MMNHTKYALIIFLFFVLDACYLYSQTTSSEYDLDMFPGFSVMIDGNQTSISQSTTSEINGTLLFSLILGVKCQAYQQLVSSYSAKWVIRFYNTDTVNHKIENVVPVAANPAYVYITADGSYEWPGYLSRSKLFRPGKGPIGVVLPDNLWHLGFLSMSVSDTVSFSFLARRDTWDLAEVRRWWVNLKPDGFVEYHIHAERHPGAWKEGMDIIFRQKFAYDLEAFNNTLFEREDLNWIRHAYIMMLQFAWDKDYYDRWDLESSWEQSLTRYDDLLGGIDIYTLWPTWPRLGLDERNQWDMYRTLPGGIETIKKQVDYAHSLGKKFFISYNPWDESTRKEEHLSGMEFLLRETDADGVVLDTRGESSSELQATADKVKPGIIMYSEGMAIPRNMPGIISGRVHDALYMPPPLNMNKFIKPDFAIFRVLQLAEGPLHREIAVSFFNGYGVEINTMRPGRPGWIKKEFQYLGKTTRILRENSDAFLSGNWEPLVEANTDSIWVNKWNDNSKTIFTILSMKPEGFYGELFETAIPVNSHVVSLWRHAPMNMDQKNLQKGIYVEIEAFNRKLLGTRKEGALECIAIFPEILHADLENGDLIINASEGDKILVYNGNPTFNNINFVALKPGKIILPVYKHFGAVEEKLVVQLFDGKELIDEVVLEVQAATPWLMPAQNPATITSEVPDGMVEIPAGTFNFYAVRDPSLSSPFIPYPDHSDTIGISMQKFYMDTYPVTNSDFYDFIEATGYIPVDTVNFLKHWNGDKPPEGILNHPVVYVSIEDANEYAQWKKSRLPTEIEWQYAAQGKDMRKYPWGNNFDSTLCNVTGSITPVTDYPGGKSPFGVMDMTGNVWQMTSDCYDNGAYYYQVIKGGSYYNPESSVWYVNGGPVPVDHPQILLLVSPGFDRCSTVGFRCVKDTQ